MPTDLRPSISDQAKAQLTEALKVAASGGTTWQGQVTGTVSIEGCW